MFTDKIVYHYTVFAIGSIYIIIYACCHPNHTWIKWVIWVATGINTKQVIANFVYWYKFTTLFCIVIFSLLFIKVQKDMKNFKVILMKKTVLNDTQRLSPDAQTGAREGFHSTLNQWRPKIICFSWLGTFCK